MTVEFHAPQREVEEVDHRHGHYKDLRALRNLFQDTMANWHCSTAHVEEVSNFVKDQTVRQEEL